MRALIVMLVLGRLIIWAAQTSGPMKRVWGLNTFLTGLGDCDLCLGFWVYLALAAVMKVNLLEPDYISYGSEIVTAVAASFCVHLARVGWTMQYGVIDLTEG